VPLLVAPAAKESFRLPKLLAGEWLGLASLLPLAFRLHGVERARWRDLLGVRALVAVVPLLLLATLGLATSRHPLHLREALADLWIGAACLVGWSVGLSRPRLLRLLAGLLVPAALLALVGILQFHGLYRPLAFEGEASAGRFALTSLAGNPGDLGAYLVLPCLFGQWLLLRERQGRHRGPVLVGTAAALSLCLYALAATQTISALAALALGSLVFWGVLAPRRFLLPAAAAFGLVVVLTFAVAPLRARVAQKAGQLAHGDWNGVLTGRLDGWRAAVWMLGEHPLAGVGQGAYRTEFAPAKLALLDRGVPFFLSQLDVNFFNAHNEILEVGADLGVPGLLALGWGLWIFLGALRRRTAGADRWIAALAWGGTAALALLSLFQFPFRIALVAFPALLFLAWVFTGSDPATTEETATTERAGVSGRAFGWGLAAVLAVALVLQGSRWYDRLEGSRLLLQVELVTRSAAAAGHAPSTLLPTHLDLLARAAALDPAEVEIPLARGNQYLLFHNPRAAIPQYRAAAALQPGPEIYFDLGGALLTAGETEEARQSFRLAVRLDPKLAARLPEEMK